MKTRRKKGEISIITRLSKEETEIPASDNFHQNFVSRREMDTHINDDDSDNYYRSLSLSLTDITFHNLFA
jgi:hypothetical protein